MNYMYLYVPGVELLLGSSDSVGQISECCDSTEMAREGFLI